MLGEVVSIKCLINITKKFSVELIKTQTN